MARHVVVRTVAAIGLTVAAVLASQVPTLGQQAPTIGTSFPDDFPEIIDASLGVPVIGFGSADGEVTRTPVILLHGNNDTPYPTDCNGAGGALQAFAQHLLDGGYAPRELWALGYQGDQCDLLTDQHRRAAEAHSTVANVPDLRAFVAAVLAYTGATQVDIVGHSLGTTLAREWMRQDDTYDLVRTLVGVDGPNHGILNCSPDAANYYAPTLGFDPDSPVCLEYGAGDTPFLTTLNGDDETPGSTHYVTIVNADVSFVYISARDGTLPAVPAQNRRGEPEDFSTSARLEGAVLHELTGQGAYDAALQTAHLGIANSPETWAITLDALTRDATPAPPTSAPPSDPLPTPLPATGGGLALAGLLALAIGARPRRVRA